MRKAYKRCALELHPDKAVMRCGGRVGGAAGFGPLAVWAEGGWEERARELADWLFKCLGEAHDCLVDEVRTRVQHA